MNRSLIIAALLLLTITACRHRDKAMSFYYWRTSFCLDSTEKAALTDNQVTTLYLRYFDIDRPETASGPEPIAPISFSCSDTTRSAASGDSAGLPAITSNAASLPAAPNTITPAKAPGDSTQIIPVVFLRNRSLLNLDSTAVDTLAANTWRLIQQISDSRRYKLTELQFDCDWTDKTRNAYFYFLNRIRNRSTLPISCTIRLHQIKYRGRTGVPPVDRGALMYYNMGNIDTGSDNSIYEPGIAAKYIPQLRTYPLQLDVALPAFSWGLLIRNGRVANLLNKMNFLHFENDPNFTAQMPGRYTAKNACFKGGYYFKAGDQIKIEHIDADGLNAIIRDVNRYSNHRLRNIIFYDLDKTNLELYDKKDFRKILDHFD